MVNGSSQACLVHETDMALRKSISPKTNPTAPRDLLGDDVFLMDGIARRIFHGKSKPAGDQRRTEINSRPLTRSTVPHGEADDMRNSRLLVPRDLGADRAEITDQGDEHGEAGFTTIVFDTCSVGEAAATITSPYPVETEALAM